MEKELLKFYTSKGLSFEFEVFSDLGESIIDSYEMYNYRMTDGVGEVAGLVVVPVESDLSLELNTVKYLAESFYSYVYREYYNDATYSFEAVADMDIKLRMAYEELKEEFGESFIEELVELGQRLKS